MFPAVRRFNEKCGIFGIYCKNSHASRICYPALWALQHRGQESSGISASDGERIKTHKGMGLVASVYNEGNISQLSGHLAIGHNRYSTSKGSTYSHAQPVTRSKNGISSSNNHLALAHNGNLPTTIKIENFLKVKNVDSKDLNDSEMMTDAIWSLLKEGATLEEAIIETYPLFTGVFSILVMTQDKIAAIRDSCGIRPLFLGSIDDGYAFSSETCAFDTINATLIREINPGEMVVVSEGKLDSYQIGKSNQKLDIFELIYFSRPDSILLGKKVYKVRKNLGINLAKENSIKADVVIPIPDSAVPAALGFSSYSKIPYDQGFTKNRYIHRTFIKPANNLRRVGVQIKLNPIPEVVKDKEVVVIDDSIVRGTTSQEIVSMLKKAGAEKVHLMISSPPVKYPDFYGIDTPSQSELIAATTSVDDIKRQIGADSLNYLSFEGMINATELSEDLFCTSCFSGIYPVDIGRKVKEIQKLIYP